MGYCWDAKCQGMWKDHTCCNVSAAVWFCCPPATLAEKVWKLCNLQRILSLLENLNVWRCRKIWLSRVNIVVFSYCFAETSPTIHTASLPMVMYIILSKQFITLYMKTYDILYLGSRPHQMIGNNSFHVRHKSSSGLVHTSDLILWLHISCLLRDTEAFCSFSFVFSMYTVFMSMKIKHSYLSFSNSMCCTNDSL